MSFEESQDSGKVLTSIQQVQINEPLRSEFLISGSPTFLSV